MIDPSSPPWPAPRLAVIVGTRPEAIKMAPVIQAARAVGVVEPVVVMTGQHDDLVTEALRAFGLEADHRIPLGREHGTSQARLLATLLPALDALLDEIEPGAVIVQGDTASAVAGALVGSWHRVPVVHLEAGLRSFDKANPFPEELYRKMIAVLADLHLTPTPWATANLEAEGIGAEHIITTGNTVVDAVSEVAAASGQLAGSAVLDILEAGRRLVLVTVHRRENWGEPLREILGAVRRIVDGAPDIEVVLPVHPNPIVRDAVEAALGSLDRVHLVEPLGYPSFVAHLAASTLVLSDSGGVQEEAPSFGVPVLVLRETTERPEAVEAGTAELVGTDAEQIASRALLLLADEAARQGMVHVRNPFGDGCSGRRAIDAVLWLVGRGPRPEAWDPAEAAS